MENLNHIYTFFIVAKEEGLTKAAKTLHLTQAAISYNLKTLETILGVKLIERSKKQFYLTESGQLLFDACHDIFGKYENTKEEIWKVHHELKGQFTLGCHVNLGTFWLSKQLFPLSKKFSDIVFHLSLGSQNLVEDVITQKTDLAFVSEELIRTKYESVILESLPDIQVVMVGSSQYLKNSLPIRKTEDLQHHILLDWPDPHSNLDYVGHKVKFHKPFQFKRTLLINNTLVIRNAVFDGLGLAVLPYYAVQKELKTGKVKAILPKRITGSAKLFFCYLKQKANSPKLITVKNYLREQLEKFL